ncbi:hypothetical protein [Paraburkholderia metrosideri]|uniref:hypothetical protein n=1 Tax=Paraburkholderia metrosideri TaxID=580937 RepID=UPI00191B6FBA|nr:hypothetical protein [Paraburkholderia metrosideri]
MHQLDAGQNVLCIPEMREGLYDIRSAPDRTMVLFDQDRYADQRQAAHDHASRTCSADATTPTAMIASQLT